MSVKSKSTSLLRAFLSTESVDVTVPPSAILMGVSALVPCMEQAGVGVDDGAVVRVAVAVLEGATVRVAVAVLVGARVRVAVGEGVRHGAE